MTTHLPDTVRLFDELPPSALIGVKHVLCLLGISRPTFYRWAKAGKFSLVKIGSSTRVTVDAVRQLINEAAQ